VRVYAEADTPEMVESLMDGAADLLGI